MNFNLWFKFINVIIGVFVEFFWNRFVFLLIVYWFESFNSWVIKLIILNNIWMLIMILYKIFLRN